ncbi:MAG: hypothetical protein ACXWUG_19320 [Polyangiales bacterium]
MKWIDAALVSAIVPVLLACGLLSPYAPGKITSPGDIAEEAVRGGPCVDLGVALSGRGEVSPITMLTRFGNKCSEAARIDLSRIEIYAQLPDKMHTLYLDDPRNEVVPLHLETVTMGTERFKLGPLVNFQPSRICVHVGKAIGVPSAPPICFEPGSGNAWEVVR